MEAVEGEGLCAVCRLHVVCPVYEAEVGHGSAHRPVFVNLIDSAEVERHAEATQSGSVNVDIVYLIICAFARVVILFLALHIRETLHRDVGHALSAHRPLVVLCEVGLQVLQLHVGACCTEEQLHLGTNAQVLVDLVRVAEGELGIGHGVHRHVTDVVGLVARVLCKLEQLVGQHGAHGGAYAQLYGVISLEALEARREQRQVHVARQTVVALAEAPQRLVGRDIGVHEGGLLLVASVSIVGVVEENVAQSEVAVHAHAHVAQCRQREIVLLVCKSRVHGVAKLKVVGEVGRVEGLCRGSAARSGDDGCKDIFSELFHKRNCLLLRRFEKEVS